MSNEIYLLFTVPGRYQFHMVCQVYLPTIWVSMILFV